MIVRHLRILLILVVSFYLVVSSTCVEKQADTEVPSFPTKFIPEGVGVNIHFAGASHKDLNLIKEAHIKLIRADLTWATVERSLGSYDFSQYDKLVDVCTEEGIRILFILDYRNRLYGDEKSIRTERQRSGFALFAQEAVKRYKGRGIMWEVWNEPNIQRFWGEEPNAKNYMKLLKVTCAAIREVDKNALIIAPSTSGCDKGYIKNCATKGLFDLVDGISVHPYREGGPESVLKCYEDLRRMMDQFLPEGTKRPRILSSEWGWGLSYMTAEIDGEVAPQLRQAAYLVRRFCIDAYAGIACGIHYKWRENNHGLIRNNLSKKPSFTALKVLNEQLTGYDESITRDKIGSPDSTFVLVFQGTAGKKCVAWRIAGTETIRIPFSGKDLKGVDFLGNTTLLKVQNNTIEIEIGEKPIYIEL
jgi:hypothetical protein